MVEVRSEAPWVAARSPGVNRLAVGEIYPIVVPLWLGAERPGVELGGAALAASLGAWPGERVRPVVTVPAPEPSDAEARLHAQTLHFLPQIAATCALLADEVAAAISAGGLALSLGGDHALAAGSIPGAARGVARLGVLYFDTHPDLNTPATSPSGHIHGMPLAAAMGVDDPALTALRGDGPTVAAEDICLLGVRDIDLGEAALIAERDIWSLSLPKWRAGGIAGGLAAALDHLTVRGVDAVHISFDLDVLDPEVLPGTGVPCPGGLTLAEAMDVMRALHSWEGPIRSFDLVELNPLLDLSGGSTDIAVALLGAALGRDPA
ncbi:MAG: arginase family protein [Chloroflexota bacterium]|nr:arginase family protein [Chloroflexota bacterium]